MNTDVLEAKGLTMATTQVLEQQRQQQVRQQLAGLSDQCNQQLTEVERDLIQTTILLNEAIEKLSASFMGIHTAVSIKQQEVARLLAGQRLSPDLADRLKAMQDELDMHIGAAVTGLQFQDMTSQLIDRTLRRVAGVKHVLSAALPEDREAPRRNGHDQLDILLHSVREALEEHGTKLEAIAKKSVAQTHMQSGDIELF